VHCPSLGWLAADDTTPKQNANATDKHDNQKESLAKIYMIHITSLIKTKSKAYNAKDFSLTVKQTVHT